MFDEEETVPPAAAGGSRPISAPKHPKTSVMVEEALTALDRRGGSSLYAIKGFILERYTLDMQRFASRICKFLREEVQAGRIVQMKGTGANGSFKLARKKKAAVAKKVNKPDEKTKTKKARPQDASGEAQEQLAKIKKLKTPARKRVPRVSIASLKAKSKLPKPTKRRK
ncbi:Hypothetical predicted protein [Cloeon dipterum]|uniref:H15 domain-containing protein n=1 Tax=Cloeon dipterum TaxID=197152 RepID=A0A8S1DKT0_9INSE|nr:Hypothetical predicted protein [Cloeon dipterum]